MEGGATHPFLPKEASPGSWAECIGAGRPWRQGHLRKVLDEIRHELTRDGCRRGAAENSNGRQQKPFSRKRLNGSRTD